MKLQPGIKRKLLTVFLLTSAFYFTCSQKVHVTTPDDITIDPKHTGMITGRVTVPEIGSDNQIIYKGIEKAGVIIEGTDFKTITVSEGIYSIDNIPAGTYNVVGNASITGVDGKWLYLYTGATKPVTVLKQQTITVPDIELNPTNWRTSIVYGKVYYKDGGIYGGKEISMNDDHLSRKIASTITSSDGSYAFYNAFNYVWGTSPPVVFVSPEGEVKTADGSIFEPDTFEGLVNKDLKVIPKN